MVLSNNLLILFNELIRIKLAWIFINILIIIDLKKDKKSEDEEKENQ